MYANDLNAFPCRFGKTDFSSKQTQVAYVRALFVNFSSAFNTIQPHLMIKKLLDLNVNSNTVLWIQRILTKRKQQVKLNSTFSPLLCTNTGAPQGCVLFTVLYTIYTNDCRAKDTDNLIIKYADDTSIVGCMSSTEDSLQCYNSKVNNFFNWCTEDNLEINVNKTKELIIDFIKRAMPIPELLKWTVN